jgi:hypothetical protein
LAGQVHFHRLQQRRCGGDRDAKAERLAAADIIAHQIEYPMDLCTIWTSGRRAALDGADVDA